MKGRIAEVFASIQGEGLYLGEKQIFVRCFGCSLECKFCDTKLDYFTEYEPEELFTELERYCKQDKYHSISFTGGEPLLQKDFLKEVLKLAQQAGLPRRQAGIRNYLETNGTLPDELSQIIDYLQIIAMDIKLPSSTGLREFWKEHKRFLEIASEKEVFLKAVICQSTKKDDLREAIKLIKEINKAAILVLQPNAYENNGRLSKKLEDFKNICRKEDVNVRIIPQVHKIIGVR